MYNNLVDETKRGDVAGRPTTELLLIEYRSLVAARTYTRVAYRFLLIALLMFEITASATSSWPILAITMVGLLVSYSWRLHELSATRRTREIGEIVAQLDNNEEVVEAYIRYRHSLWEEEQNLRLQRLEPLVWLAMFIVIAVISLSLAFPAN